MARENFVMELTDAKDSSLLYVNINHIKNIKTNKDKHSVIDQGDGVTVTVAESIQQIKDKGEQYGVFKVIK